MTGTKPRYADWLERVIVAAVITILLTGASTYLAQEHVKTEKNTLMIETHSETLRGSARDMKEVKDTLIRVEAKVDRLTELVARGR